MFAKPTIDDYTHWIKWHLSKAAEDAERAINIVVAKSSTAGAYRSGRTIVLVFEEAFSSFDKGVDTALGELKRALRLTDLNRFELRSITEVQLQGFAERVKKLTRYEQLREFAGPKSVNERLAQFEERLAFTLRQFDVGFLDPLEPEVPLSMNNHINIGVMSGGAVQQGTSHSKQDSHTEIDVQLARDALQSFEQLITSADAPHGKLSDLAADIATIKAQLTKPQPSATILREAGSSLRNLTEGIVSGALTGPVVAAGAALWRALGLG
jgi:hypothetical protein